MNIRDKIWYELVDAKFGEIYLSLYISKQKWLKKMVKISTLVFSGSGVLGWTVWQYIPVISCLLVSVLQLLSLVENEIIRSDKEIEEICELRLLYISYFNKLDRLWYEVSNDIEGKESFVDHFYSLKNNDHSEIEKLDNKLYIRKLKNLIEKTDYATRDYLTKYIPYV